VSTSRWPARWQATIGVLKRLGIWLAILGIWEGAYRLTAFDLKDPDAGGWKHWIFPAPSHVIDATLGLLNVPTYFGEPVSRGWPWVQRDPVSGQVTAWTGGPRGKASSAPWYNSPLITANWVSATRLMAGFAISIVLGGALGMLMWRFKPLDQFFGPLFLGLQTLPSVCWVPLSVLVFGYTEVGILFVLVMGSFFAVAIALRDGLRTIPPIYQRAGLMLGAKGWRKYRYVLLPASLPAMASSLRQGFSFAWRSLMGAELIFLAVRARGLGFQLSFARDNAEVGGVIAIMIIMVVIGMVADRLVFAKLQHQIQRRFGLATAH
jgi:NitT/TauT family transport system permease protein